MVSSKNTRCTRFRELADIVYCAALDVAKKNRPSEIYRVTCECPFVSGCSDWIILYGEEGEYGKAYLDNFVKPLEGICGNCTYVFHFEPGSKFSESPCDSEIPNVRFIRGEAKNPHLEVHKGFMKEQARRRQHLKMSIIPKK